MTNSIGLLAALASLLKFALQFLVCVLATDFVSGLFHWLEDAYGREDFPITGRLFTRPNILHHHHPRHFTRNSWLESSWDLTCMAGLGLLIAWSFGILTWHAWVMAILGANANQIHKWAHRTPSENGRFVSFFQRYRILQSPGHHAVHHTDPKNSHYCVLTDFLNPILDGIGFWQGSERLIYKIFGFRRRVDPSVRAHPVEEVRTLSRPLQPLNANAARPT